MVLANRKIALGNIQKSSLKKDRCVIELGLKNTKNKESLSENKQTRWKFKQTEAPKSLSYHFSEKYQKSDKKKSGLKNKPMLYKQKALTKSVISLSSIHSGSGDEVVKKSENKKEHKQSKRRTAHCNNFNFSHRHLVNEAVQKSKYKKMVSENKQSQLGQQQITKNKCYSDSIHERSEKVKKSSTEKWVSKYKQSVWMFTQNAHLKNMCYFSSSHKLNKNVKNFKNKESASESKRSVWLYKQTAPPNTVSYFTYLVLQKY